MDNPIVEIMPKGKKYKLKEDFTVACYISERSLSITVPAGFVTNFASVPRLFWSIVPPSGRYTRAAIVHDYLYSTHIVSKRDADKIFLILMRRLKVPWWKRKTMYRAVKWFGGSAWKKGGK